MGNNVNLNSTINSIYTTNNYGANLNGLDDIDPDIYQDIIEDLDDEIEDIETTAPSESTKFLFDFIKKLQTSKGLPVLNFPADADTDEEKAALVKAWIEDLARDRGLSSNSTQFTSFVNKFMELYSGTNIPANNGPAERIADIYSMIKIYDSGMKNLDIIDDYAAILIKKDFTDIKDVTELEKYTRSLYYLDINSGSSFDNVRTRYINILSGVQGSQKQKILLDALKYKKVPISGDSLTLPNLEKVILHTEDAVKDWIHSFVVSKDLNFPGLENKFLQLYNAASNNKDFDNLVFMANFFAKQMKNYCNPDLTDTNKIININDLGQYFRLVMHRGDKSDQQLNKEMSLLFRFEVNQGGLPNGLPIPDPNDPNENIDPIDGRNDYINILINSNNSKTEQKRLLLYALNTGKIPAVDTNKQELNINNLNTALIDSQSSTTEEYFIDTWIQKLADERSFGTTDDPNLIDTKDEFIEKLKLLYKNHRNEDNIQKNLEKLVKLYDLGMKKSSDLNAYFNFINSDTNIAQSQVLTVALALFKFQSDAAKFTVTSPDTIDSKRNEYLSILTNADGTKTQKQKIILDALKLNKVPYSNEPLTVASLDTVLDKFNNEEAGKEFYIENLLKNFADKDILKAKFYTEYASSEGLGLDTKSIEQLLTMYKTLKSRYPEASVDDMDIYAQALKNGLSILNANKIFNLDLDPNFRDSMLDNERIARISSILEKATYANTEEVTKINKAIKDTLDAYKDEQLTISQIQRVISTLGIIDEDNLNYVNDLLQSWNKDYKLGTKDFKFLESLSSNKIKKLIKEDESLSEADKIEILQSLEIYAQYMSSIKSTDLSTIDRFINSETFANSTEIEKENALQEYLQILASSYGYDVDNKAIILNSIKKNKIVAPGHPLDGQALTPANLKQALFDPSTWIRKIADTKVFGPVDANDPSKIDTKAEFIAKLEEYFDLNKDKVDIKKCVEDIVKLYEAGMKDPDDMDAYFGFINSSTNIDKTQIYNVALALFNFQKTAGFSSTKRDEYLAILTNQNGSKTSQQRVLVEALKLNRIPYNNKALNVENLDDLLDAFKTEEGGIEFRIDAKVASLVGSHMGTANQLKAKFYNQYHKNYGLGIEQIEHLMDMYRELKTEYPDASLNEMDIYAQALKDGLPMPTVDKIFSLTMNKDLRRDTTTVEREAYITAVINQAITAKLNGDDLDKVIDDILDSSYERYVTDWIANSFEDPEMKADAIELVTNWNIVYNLNGFNFNFLKDFLTEKYLDEFGWRLASDEEKMGLLKSVSVYAKYLSQILNPNDIKHIDKYLNIAIPDFPDFPHNDNRNKEQAAKRKEKAEKYLQVLSGTNNNLKLMLMMSIKSGRIVAPNSPLNGRAATIENLDQLIADEA